MQEETTVFKLDVSDENIKRNTMNFVWRFPGVTLVDVNEKGKLKVRGYFDKYEMGRILWQEIDNSVDIITNPIQSSEQNHIPGFNTVYNYLNPSTTQEIVVFEFRVLNERIIWAAMQIIWEFSEVTSVEVERDFYLRVKGGEVNKLEMVMKLKNVDEHVKILWERQNVEAEPKKQTGAGSSNLRTGHDTTPKKTFGDYYRNHAPQYVPFDRQQGINQAKQPLINGVAHGPFYEQANQLPNFEDANWREIMDKYNAKNPFQRQQKGGYAAQNYGKQKQQPGQVNKPKPEAGMLEKLFGLGKKQHDKVNLEVDKPRNAELHVPQMIKGRDGNYKYVYPYTEGAASLGTSFRASEFGSSSRRNRSSSFSGSSSGMDLSQFTQQGSSMAYSSQFTPPSSSSSFSHSRSRSSENLSQTTFSSSTGNPYASLDSNRSSRSNGGQSSTQTQRRHA